MQHQETEPLTAPAQGPAPNTPPTGEQAGHRGGFTNHSAFLDQAANGQGAHSADAGHSPQPGAEFNGASRSAARGFDADAAWRMTLADLAMQMPPTQFDTWLRNTYVLAYEDGEFIIGTPNGFAHGWLDKQVRPKIKRTLGRIAGRTVQITFRTAPRALPAEADLSDMPLYSSALAGAEASSGADRHGIDGRAGLDGSVPLGPSAELSMGPNAGASGGESGDSHAGSNSDGELMSNADGAAAASSNGSSATRAGGASGSGASTNGASADGASANGASGDARTGTERNGETWLDQPASPSLPASAPASIPAHRAPTAGDSPTNPLFVFETFVVGKYNQLAHAAAQAVANQPGHAFNPLFIHGGVGLGKTHLLHAIANRARQLGWATRYCTSEQFTNDLISAIRTQDTEAFRNRYREVDVLLIDDIQFIGGKESTQEEFFHTFNHLHSLGRQIVISSDRPPKSLATLEERLRSRFAGGLQADISKPDYETRVAILQSKARRADVYIHDDVLRLVAERVESNVRELEGALKSLVMQARMRDSSALSLPLAEHMLDNLAPQRLPCAPALVIEIVAAHYRLQPDELTGKRRPKNIAHARQVAMYLLREENGLSLPVIGEHLGGRDHSTIRYGIGRVEKALDTDDALRRDIMQLREKIYAPFRD